MRNWSISTRLLSLLALPVVAATSLGVLRIQQSLQNVDQLEHMTTLTEMTRQATLLADALQEERDKSADPLTAGNRKDDDVVATREATDAAISSFTSASKDLENDNDLPGIRSTATQIINQLNTINQLRNDAYTNEDYLSQTVSSYNQLIELLLALSQDMAQATSNTEMIGATRALASFSNAKEYESMQRALISAALARKGGPELSEADAFFGNTTAQAEEAALARFAQIYGNEASLKLTRAIDGDIPEVREADEFRERVLKKPSTLKTGGLSSRDWYDKSSTKIDEMSKIQSQLLNDMEQQARQLRTEAQRDALLNGAVVVLVLGVALVGSFVMARSMIRSLRRLQDTAQEVSQKRLPELVKQLSEADPQDVDTSIEPIGIDSTDEIGRVAHAFEEVHREAVRLAAEQALLRGNVNAMFTNLSRRSQGLIQRQLTLISELESREADPDQLSNLFKLDHLATRMRRNGENLLVLAGEEPGRRWTRPVPLVDVLRAAASEVEQYERIELTSVPATEVAGRVVNDLVHLLAELLENATSFSSPQTKVRVTGHALPDGRVLIEIHDTGIGLSPEDLADINERLANPPTVDVSVSRRMGLFVVGRLSRRHGIRIQLRPSDSGGTTALVMLPVDVTQNGKAVPGNRGRNGQPGGGQGQVPPAGLGPQPGQVAAGRQRPALPGADGPGPAGRGPAGRGGPGAGGRPGAPQRPGGRGTGHAPGRNPGAPGDAVARPAQPSAGPQGPRHAQQPSPGAPGAPGHGDRHPSPSGAPGGRTGRGEPPLPPRRVPSERPGADSPRSEPVRGEWPREHQDAGSTQAFARPDLFSPGGQGGRGPAARPQYPVEETGGGLVRRPQPPAPQPPAPQPPAPQPVRPEQQPVRPEQQLPPSSSPMALPPAPSRGDERTPIFEAIESDWFHQSQGGAPHPDAPQGPGTAGQAQEPRLPREQQAPQAPLPPRRPVAPASPHHEPPASRTAGPDLGGQAGPDGRGRAEAADPSAPHWRSSPNDEGWRRAEQIRKPQAGGITPSGLPRRVPKANLVPGTAQQTPPVEGPQVSRAPDDVRGRLTNLRRGIQQGRQAGGNAGGGFGTSHQQER